MLKMILTVTIGVFLYSNTVFSQTNDLYFTSGEPTVTPSLITRGDTTRVSAWTLYNQGIQQVASPQIAYYLSTDSIITTSDIFLFSPALNFTMGPNSSLAWIDTTITIFGNINPGSYYLGILVDPGNVVNELNENNNYVTTKVNIATVKPDIQFLNIPATDPLSLEAGQNIFIPGPNVVNYGGYATDIFGLGYYISSDTILDSTDQLLESVFNQYINGGDTITATAQVFPIPANTSSGNYYIALEADFENVVDEDIEDNNTIFMPFTVLNTIPELSFPNNTIQISPDIVNPGDTLQIDWTIINNGTATLPFINGFYLSTDTTIDILDTLLGQSQFATGLMAGATAFLINEFAVIPQSITPGNYYFGILLDMNNDVPEIDENNNSLSIPFVISITLDVNEFDSDILPTSFSLSQNFPNPFNPSTSIQFTIPKSSYVQINIYNTLGRNVKQLVNKELSIGNYQIEWDGKLENGSIASSGIYFYKMQTDEFSENMKMILLK